MVRALVLRGVGAGALGGLLAFLFGLVFAEPLIQTAIDYEGARGEAQDALDAAAGIAAQPGGPELVNRGLQASLGIGVGMLLFGVAVGALFAVAYTLLWGRVGALRPRTLAVLLALGGFLTLYLVPFLKYPGSPPAVGHDDTIGPRTGLYLIMVAGSVLAGVVAVWVGRRLVARLGNWNATVLAGLSFVVLVGVLMVVLPSLGQLGVNVEQYGNLTTETPLPLRNSAGDIVFPGFDPDLLYSFRLYSVAAQALLWTTIGLAFAPLAERVLGRAQASRGALGTGG